MTKTIARTLAVALLLSGLAGTLAPRTASARDEAATIDRLIKRGRKALKKELYEKALQRFTAADELSGGTSAEALAGLGDALFGLERFQEAIETGDRLLDVATDDRQQAKANNVIGLAYFQRGQADQLDLEATISNDHHTSKSGRRAARLTDEQRRRKEAVNEEFLAAADAFRRVIELTGGQYAVNWENYAEALYRGGRYADSLRALDQLADELDDGAELSEHAARLRSCVEVLAASDESHVYDLRDLPDDVELVPPRRVYAPIPKYTYAARMNRLQGVIIVQGVVTKEGDYICVDVLQGLPLGLTESALETLRTWKFEPATLDGEPINAHYALTTDFRLQ